MGCGATEKDFKFWMPLEVIKGKEGEMRVAGIASDENAKDMQGEKVFVDGLDTSYLVERGAFNWNHGKEASDILGEIDKADKHDGKLHVEGFLYPHVDQAKATWNLMRSMKDSGSNRRLGLSIEGKVKERLGKEVRKAWLKNVAITYNPINGGTWVDMLKSFEGMVYNPCQNTCKEECSACKFMEKSDKVVELLEKDPNPTDKKIHDLADKMGIEADKLEAKIYAMIGDIIEHGKGATPDPKQLEMGIEVEKEHTKSPELAKWIAMAHLKEFPDYYTRLKQMEDAAKAAKIEKGQKIVIDARVENLASRPSTPEEQEADQNNPDRCAICGKVIFPDGTCNCDPRDEVRADHETISENLDITTPNATEAAYVRADKDADLEKQLGAPATAAGGMAAGFEREEKKKKEETEKAMSAGYDISAATGGVSGSAVREEDLDKKKKVTTYDERHLGLTKKDVKEMVKSKGYSDETSDRLTDAIFMMVELQKAHPHKYIKKLGTGSMAQYFYQMPKLGERLHEPTDSEWQHEKMRINQAFDKKNMEGFIATRMNRIADPQKMFAFARALEDENLHKEAGKAYKRLEDMGFQWQRVGKGLVGSAGSYAWVKVKDVAKPVEGKFTAMGFAKEPKETKKPELKEEVKKIEEETAKPVKEKVKTGLEKLKDEFSNVNVTSSTKTETKTGKRIEVASRMKKPDISKVIIISKERPVDYGHCGDLMKEKYGNARGEKSYESMIDVGNSGIFFVAGEEIQKEKRAMMNALGKTGELDNHDYQGLYKEWLSIGEKPNKPKPEMYYSKELGKKVTVPESEKEEEPKPKKPVYQGGGRLIEAATEKSFFKSYKPGSLGHSFSLLDRKGKTKVKEHHRIQSGHLIQIDKHRRHLHSDAELQKLLKQSVQSWMASGVRGNPFAKWLQKNDFDSYSKLSGMLGFPIQGKIEKGGPGSGRKKHAGTIAGYLDENPADRRKRLALFDSERKKRIGIASEETTEKIKDDKKLGEKQMGVKISREDTHPRGGHMWE